MNLWRHELKTALRHTILYPGTCKENVLTKSVWQKNGTPFNDDDDDNNNNNNNGIVTRSLRKNLEAVPGKKFHRFTTKDSYTWNITHNTESTAV